VGPETRTYPSVPNSPR